MKIDYRKQNNILSYLDFLESYKENELFLKPYNTEEIKKEIATVKNKILNSCCNEKRKYEIELESLQNSIYSGNKDIETYLKDKEIIIKYFVEKNLIEELKKISDIDEEIKNIDKTKKVVKKSAVKSK